jgi:hypothetical protein
MATTSTSSQSAAQAQAAANAAFLKWAKVTPNITLQGTIPAAVLGGGPAANVAWNQPFPTVPNYVKNAVFNAQVPLAVTLPAGASITVSQLFPYSLFNLTLSVGGVNYIENIPLADLMLDLVTSGTNRDLSYTGLTRGYSTSSPFGSGSIVGSYQDDGGNMFNLGGLAPGQVITNSGSSSITQHYEVSVTFRVQFQRRPSLTAGLVPAGSVQSRPRFTLQLNPLWAEGNQCVPSVHSFNDTASAGDNVAIDTGGVVVNAAFESLACDNLPSGMAIPVPTVGMAVKINRIPVSNVGVGVINYQQIQDSALYDKIFVNLVNNGLDTNLDYLALSKTTSVLNNLWTWDAVAAGNLFDYYSLTSENYNRQLPTGHFVLDLLLGNQDTIAETPQYSITSPNGLLMTPDAGIAANNGIACTPAMSTMWRFPSAIVASNPQVYLTTFGWVPVNY